MSLSGHPGCLYIVWACSNHACTGRGHIVIMFDVMQDSEQTVLLGSCRLGYEGACLTQHCMQLLKNKGSLVGHQSPVCLLILNNLTLLEQTSL